MGASTSQPDGLLCAGEGFPTQERVCLISSRTALGQFMHLSLRFLRMTSIEQKVKSKMKEVDSVKMDIRKF